MPSEIQGSGRSTGANRSAITRRRTGCVPCRDRHVKCDERKPVCRRCDRSSTDCVWNRDIRIVIHSPEFSTKGSVRTNNDTATDPSTCTTSISTSSGTNDSRHGLDTQSDDTGSDIVPNIASLGPADKNCEPQLESFTNWGILQASELVQDALRTDLEVLLMHNYLTEVAPWFDAHTGKQFYSRIEVPRMLKCPPWRAAALALSCKNIELRERRRLTTGPESLPLHLYQLAVRLAIDSMSGRFESVGSLAGCVLLCVYEMMTVTYTDWRRHVQGCASIYTHNGWNGSTGGLISGSFWDYARIDIWAAFCATTRTMMSTESWFDDPIAVLARDNIDEDLHSQVAIWLTARVINAISDGMLTTTREFFALRSAMRRWEEMGSPTTHPVVRRESDGDPNNPFPRILFSTHSSTIGHTMWNSAMVLLLEYQASHNLIDACRLRDDAYQHALTATGIIETNNHTACLVNSLQPAFICGRHMRTKSEKFAVLELLAQIERKTGWKCGWRSDGLREYWNLC